MATCGTTFVMVETVTGAAWWCGAVMGFLAVAILVANNLRDIPTDDGDRQADPRGAARRPAHADASTVRCVVAAFATSPIGVLVDIANEGSGSRSGR